VVYAYDRFGRVLQDGDLRYHYDPNGNRTEVEYPGGVIAQYAFDALDRPESLNLSTGGSVQPVATGATYYPAGPLAGLTLGNGLVETRSYDARYFPTAIQLGGKLHWNYTTDREGNILQIADALNAAQTKTYSYQDYQYYLTTGNGPWGNLSWSYDPLGNRLTETRDGSTDQYTYQLNATGGRTAKLVEIAPPADTATQILYDAIGSQAYESTGPDKVIRSFDAAGRMSQEIQGADPAGSPMSRFVYDGRSYLRRAEYLPTAARGEVTRETTAVYSSEGVLHQRFVETRTGVEDERGFVGGTERVSILYFGSRPVGQFEQDGNGERLRFLTVDHLGTPVAITAGDGSLGWAGGFEPFGADYGGAGEGGVFLRFPGQWGEENFGRSFYNLHRWYESRSGRYIRVDPIILGGRTDFYAYGLANALRYIDPLGLAADAPRNPRNLFKPIIDPYFGSGPWGARPNPDCCDQEAIAKSRASGERQLAQMASGGVPSGTSVGSFVMREHSCREDGWCFPLVPTDPFDPPVNAKITDPCVVFCLRIHEWYHYQDQRPWNYNWSQQELSAFWETSGYEFQLECLKSF
jgi:RHS repeat-associated protein